MINQNTNADIKLEIRDDKVDSEAIMTAIRDAILRRREEADRKGIDFDALASGTLQHPASHRFDSNIYESLLAMSALKTKSQVGMHLTGPAVPVIGPFIQKIRRALHMLVLFYVNMSAENQITFNAATTKAILGIVRTLDRETAYLNEIEALRAEISRLSERLAAIEKRQI